MTQIVVYPRLYQTQVPGPDDKLQSRGDQTVTELFRIYEQGVQDTRNLNFRFRVLDCAIRLFGDFREWMLLQRNNPNLVGYNLEFLRDTLKYVATGGREITPLIWGDLVSEKNDHSSSANHLTAQDLSIPKNLSTAEFIQLWCSRKGGFDDLIQTLFVLFGTARGAA